MYKCATYYNKKTAYNSKNFAIRGLPNAYLKSWIQRKLLFLFYRTSERK